MKRHILFSGGLGNQMFQYSFYLSLIAKGLNCIIDPSLFYRTSMHNGFELGKVFHIENSILKPTHVECAIASILYKFRPSSLVFSDKPYQFCPEAYSTNCVYYVGCWINSQYLIGVERQLLKAFTFRGISDRNKTYLRTIQGRQSVSLHIRRGDYLTNQIYSVCGDQYYKEAISLVLKRTTQPFFVVFSDDPEWCQDYMKQFEVEYEIVNWNKEEDSYQDMYMMSQCKHNIIANSTFSWWGAWLNQNPDRIVVSPHNWTHNHIIDFQHPNWEFIV